MSNIDPTLEEVISIVDEINIAMPVALSEEYVSPLTVVYETWGIYGVKAFDIVVWSSSEDEREYLEGSEGRFIDEKEDLESYLRRTLTKICTVVLEGLNNDSTNL